MMTDASHVAYIILAPAGGIVMTILNGFTVFIFSKKFRLQYFSLIFIVNICLCDIVVCVFSNFFYVLNLLHPTYDWWTGDAACRIFKMVTMTTNVAQIFSLCAINADRMRRLIEFSAKQWNKAQAVRVLVVIWAVSICLTLPRPFIFTEKVIKKPVAVDLNETSFTIVNINCKPVDVGQAWFAASSVALFVLAYALPTAFVVYTTVRAQVYMWRRRRQIHLANIRARVIKMNHDLSLTFNLTAAMFLVVWSPFFILSMVDLVSDMVNRKHNRSVNFGLRCTLLIIGSAKPVIYIICLRRFRDAWRCLGLSGDAAEAGTSSAVDQDTMTESKNTKSTKVAQISEKNVFLQDENRVFSPVFSTTQC